MKIYGNNPLLARIPSYFFQTCNRNSNFLPLFNPKLLFSTIMTSKNSNEVTLGLDPFCFKQFDDKAINHIPYPKESFLEKVRECVRNGSVLRDGYAPFCKHLILKNFTEATCGTIEITEENSHLLKSGYVARTEDELPVLTRWFKKDQVPQFVNRAEFLDVIFYSREQVIREYKARNTLDSETQFKHDYYVISIKPQNVDYELPMSPITIMRNALIEEGGSGVSIDRQKYLNSVKYWSKHAVILP